MSDICAVKARWRQMLQVHPAADVFPLLGKEDVVALAADIKKHGLKQPVLIIEGKDGHAVLIDGRNRLDALELLGEEITLDNSTIFERLPTGTESTRSGSMIGRPGATSPAASADRTRATGRTPVTARHISTRSAGRSRTLSPMTSSASTA